MKYLDYYSHLNEILSRDENIAIKKLYVIMRDLILDLKKQLMAYTKIKDFYKNVEIFRDFFMRSYKPVSHHAFKFPVSNIERPQFYIGMKFPNEIKQHLKGIKTQFGNDLVVSLDLKKNNMPMGIALSEDFKHVVGFIVNINILVDHDDIDITKYIQHELQHIADLGGANPGSEEIDQLNYYLNPDEIKAYAKQIAYLYHKKFPNDRKLDFEKIETTKWKNHDYMLLVLYTKGFNRKKEFNIFFPNIKLTQELLDKIRSARNDFFIELKRSLNYFIKLDAIELNEIEFKVAPYKEHPNGLIGWKGKMVYMTPEKFLSLAKPIEYPSQDTLDSLKKAMQDEQEIPHLMLWVDMNAKKVTGHEGRHRAMVAKELGIEKVPVFIFTGEYTRTPKWSQADHDIVNNVKFSPEV